MKKIAILIALVMILMVPVCAFALPYSDPAGDFSIEIPEEAGTYYYTPGGTNMSPELLESIKDKDDSLALLIASYATQTDNALSYSLDITETPLAVSGASGAAATPTEDPAASAPVEGALSVTDFSMLNDEQIAAIVAQKQAEYGEDYVFDPHTVEQLNGKTAIVLTGRLAEDNGYTTKIYMIAQNNTNFSITSLYKNDEADTFLNQAMVPLNSLQFTSAAAVASPSVEPTPVPTPQPTAAVVVTPEPMPTPTPEPTGFAAIGAFFSNLGNNIQNAYYNDPNFVFYVLGAAVIIAVVIIVILLLKSRSKKNKGGKGNKPSLPDDNVGSTPDPVPEAPKTSAEDFNDRYQADISRYTQQPNGYDLSDVSRYTQQPEGHQAQDNATQAGGYNPSDISRYTQQPKGYDLSDVSRYTQQPKGYRKSTADISERVEKTEPYQNRVPLSQEAIKNEPPRDPNAPKVGSRAARHKKK
ncbi:MAG: hypothetical protein VB081_12150 [Christensenella sp.]|uniref:hypothetical protein n=1 Tax=Christensenella sp. TaxID=1935934 RepID=UPI002B208F52|nr:hypothetical protein [Christensenella sp.]MEA5004238.1 hypothetical protein [Christensenella sp.]